MSIQFACPHCGKQTVVADQYAGQTGPCASCGAQVTVPYSGTGTIGPPTGGSKGTSPLLIILAVVVVAMLACGGLLAAIVVPAVFSARSAAQRVNSMNHLKQIGLALHNYYDTHNTFPPAVVTDKDGKPLYSGRVLLLPYIERGDLYDRFDKAKAWDSAENLAVSQTMIDTFLDPARTTGGPFRSDYVFVTGKNTILEGNSTVRFADITDGTSNTVIAIETSQGPASWAAPGEWDVDSGTLPPSNHERVRLILYADGSVRPMDHAAAQQIIRAAATRNGGEVIPF
ncbi:hypothetical protein ETAA8_64240 [Anatilimnocola aggregata]|uniref:DUF1559 domain-containing protein n=1 Tax=Anatilimnocola aggregata TaxID=2528021 RepID=A0A517YM28_9BACT|nr:DUF1559 domain-containing protein [Anatilimnocola aggregata]QDU31271.1 hypothetical protein ETAA8_64240 [Anatilimnocola aggregata]